MAADVMAAKPVADGQRSFEVDQATGLQAAEVGARERFLARFEVQHVAIASDNGQATSAATDAVADRDTVGHDWPRIDPQFFSRALVDQFDHLTHRFNQTGEHRSLNFPQF